MSKHSFAVFGLFVLLMSGTCLAQVDVQKTLSNLDVSAIKKMQVVQTSTDYTLDVVLILTNAKAEALRFRNGQAEVSFDRPNKEPMIIGQTVLSDQIAPGKKGDQSGTAVLELSIYMGPKDHDTMAKLIEVFNIVGDPVRPLKMSIQGKSEVGLQLPRGWFFEQGKKFEVELAFTPAIQREILLK
jgi:hypothetical protein